MTRHPYVLRLYVNGRSARSDQAIATMQDITSLELAGTYELEVIDVVERPQLAEDERIVATPTLIKECPPPLRRIVGDLTDRERVLRALGLVDF